MGYIPLNYIFPDFVNGPQQGCAPEQYQGAKSFPCAPAALAIYLQMLGLAAENNLFFN